MTDNTPEAQAELESRIVAFNKELEPLLLKYELTLGSSAFLQPNGTVSSRPIVLDTRGQNTAAPAAAPETSAPEAAPEGVTAA